MNMSKKSPLFVSQIQFYAYDQNQTDDLRSISQLPFDDRSDFTADSTPGGVAVKIFISNERFDSGVRRNIQLDLVDATERYVIASQSLKVNLTRQEYLKEVYANFATRDIKPGHTYKLVISDTSASQTLTERVFRLIDPTRLPHPTEWYGVCNGGIRPAWDSNLFKSIDTQDGQSYYIRFNLMHKLGYLLPSPMPELELRLFVPDSQETVIHFDDPKCQSEDDYRENRWFVEFPFTTAYDRNGVFYAELLCMEYPIAGFVFNTDVDDEPGEWYGAFIEPLDEYTPDTASDRWVASRICAKQSTLSDPEDFDKLLDSFIEGENTKAETESDEPSQQPDPDDQTETTRDESCLSSLDSLTGLRSVKDKLAVYERVVRFNKKRTDMGLPTTCSPLHAMFLGSPGTGKTTVAKMIGVMLRRAGVLSKGHVVVRERATLLGQYYSSESEKTLAAIEEAKGGILFIDEAYQLYQPDDSRDPGKFVIETLLTALADESNRDWMLILAGYSDKMKQMFDMNPGFKSRIPDSNIYIFDDFTESELMEIAENYLTRYNYTLSTDARRALTDRLNADYVRRDMSFGNARHVINMIQTEILPSMAVRVIAEGLEDQTALTEIQAADIPPAPAATPKAPRQRIGFTS